MGKSAISSNSKVPCPASSKKPGLLSVAPVKAPLACPNSWEANNSPLKAAQFRVKKGCSFRWLQLCRFCAANSLPLPDSPCINTGYGELANCLICILSNSIAVLLPTMPLTDCNSLGVSAEVSTCRFKRTFSSAISQGLATKSTAPNFLATSTYFCSS